MVEMKVSARARAAPRAGARTWSGADRALAHPDGAAGLLAVGAGGAASSAAKVLTSSSRFTDRLRRRGAVEGGGRPGNPWQEAAVMEFSSIQGKSRPKTLVKIF